MPARFQSFDEPAETATDPSRLAALRAELARRGVQGFVVPRADEHQSEYVPANAERLAWLTGFTGSAGTAVVLAERAALFVDGRYVLQAPEQVDVAAFEIVNSGKTSPNAWIEAHLPAGATIAYDPWLHTRPAVERLKVSVEAAGGGLVPLDGNPIDALWSNRPPAPQAPLRIHPVELAGEAAPAKLERVRTALAKVRVDALIVSDPHNMAWAFNIRGGDVSHTPLALGYALIPREGRPTLFLDPAKVAGEVERLLGEVADLRGPGELARAVDELGAAGARIRIDEATGAAALASQVEAAGGTASVGADPITLMKAAKNEAEIRGARAAHLRDGAAVATFLAWLSREAPLGRLTEIEAAEKLEECRAASGRLEDISFPTIAGAGPNGAIVHYRVTTRTNRQIEPGCLFLVDSGAQYQDGTTDVTRTIAIGEPTPEMRERFTRVLKGHIAIARAVFPAGTTGAQLDSFARAALWEVGLDFDHGTGHGVGSFLSVHEGPQRIAKAGHTPLEPGMLMSNEPGYYKSGAYGIRIENLVLVERREIAGAEREMLGFETLTLVPIDLRLVEAGLLGHEERAWLDAYHRMVFESLATQVDDATRAWLASATRALG